MWIFGAKRSVCGTLQSLTSREHVMEKIDYYRRALSQELGLLDRIVYKFKNQHGRLGYFRSVFRVTRELRLFCVAFRETFYSESSTGDAENYYKNLKDLKRMVRRVKWDLKDAGTSISRLLAHGFFLPMVFLLLSSYSRLYSVVINITLTIDRILPAIPFGPSGAHDSTNSSLTANSHAARTGPEEKSLLQTPPPLKRTQLAECFDEEDLGEVIPLRPAPGRLCGSSARQRRLSREGPGSGSLPGSKSCKSGNPLAESAPVRTTNNQEDCVSGRRKRKGSVPLDENLPRHPPRRKRSRAARTTKAWSAHAKLRSKLRKL